MTINATVVENRVEFRLGSKLLGKLEIAYSDALPRYIIDIGEGLKVAVNQDEFNRVFAQLQPEEVEQIASGHNLSLSTIFDIYAKNHPSDTSFFLCAAASVGDLEEVKKLCFSYKKIPEKELLNVINIAASGGYRDVVQFLLSQGSIPDDELFYLIISALSGGHLDVVRFLLSKRPLTDNELGYAIEAAASSGHLEMVQLLLPPDRSLPTHQLAVLIQNSIMNGYLEIVQFLLLRVQYFDINQAVITASRSGHPAMVDFFLGLGYIDEETRIAAISAATGAHREEIVRMLQPPIGEPRFIHPHAIHVSFTELKENPLKYLNLFSSLDKFPPYFVDKDSPAADLGGVTRQFVTLLMEELVKQNIIPLSTTGLPMIRQGFEENDKAMMEKLGHFYSLLEQSNSTNFIPRTTGSVFDPAFFKIVQAVAKASPEEDLVRNVAEILSEVEPNFTLAREVILKPTDANKAKYAEDIMGSEDEADQAPRAARKFVSQYVDAAKCFYDSANEYFAEQIKKTDPKKLCDYVQGEGATAAVIIGALRVDPENQNPLFLENVRLLKKFIESKDDAWRRQFLKAVTGSTSLPAGAKITIEATEQLFAIATCFMNIQIPVMRISSEEQYLAYLNEVFSSDEFTSR